MLGSVSGQHELVLRGEGRRRLVTFEKFMERVQVLGLDGARARAKPARVFSDADLLIAATAAFHGQEFATSEVNLAEGLRQLAFPRDGPPGSGGMTKPAWLPRDGGWPTR